jgi:hypothetical protein
MEGEMTGRICTTVFGLIVGLALATEPARAEYFESNGYALRLDVQQVARKVMVAGRVEGGTYCPLLRVEIRLRNDAGTNKRLKVKVNEAGDFYSRLIEGSLTVKNAPTSWTIDGVTAQCERR